MEMMRCWHLAKIFCLLVPIMFQAVSFGMKPLEEKYNARFFTYDDEKQDNFAGKWQLPNPWWSRPYEYAWAAQFAKSEDIALDAACGIEHPFKYFLAETCKSVYACDIDERILNKAEVILQTAQSFSLNNNLIEMASKLYDAIEFTHENLTHLAYNDQTFDKIYCISVLEHLNKIDFEKTLIEFRRILKDDGLIILTFDYPSINLQLFQTTIKKIGLQLVGNSSFELPKNPIYSDLYKLYCFRAILIKAAKAIQ